MRKPDKNTKSRIKTRPSLDELIKYSDKEIRNQVFLTSPSLDLKQDLFIHQSDAVDSVSESNFKSGVLSLPTGSGKTRIGLEIALKLLQLNKFNNNTKNTVLWASYPIAVTFQALLRFTELKGLFPNNTSYSWMTYSNSRVKPKFFKNLDVGFIMREDLGKLLYDVSIIKSNPVRNLLESGDNLNIVYDECHQLAATDLQKGFKELYDWMDENHISRNQLRVIGLSATPLPTDEKKHKLLKEHIFPIEANTTNANNWPVHVHSTVSIKELEKLNILCPIKRTYQDIFIIPEYMLKTAWANRSCPDFPQVGEEVSMKMMKDLIESFNNQIFRDEDIMKFLARRIIDNLDRLGKTMIFSPNVSAAKDFMATLIDCGLEEGLITLVHSQYGVYDHRETGTPWEQIEEFRSRSGKCICISVDMLTTGYDDPKVQSVCVFRVTSSRNLLIQMIGRGRRGLKFGGTKSVNLIEPIQVSNYFGALSDYAVSLETESQLNEEIDPQVNTPLVATDNEVTYDNEPEFEILSDTLIELAKEIDDDEDRLNTLITKALKAFIKQTPEITKALVFPSLEEFLIVLGLEPIDTLKLSYKPILLDQSKIHGSRRTWITKLIEIAEDIISNNLNHKIDLFWFNNDRYRPIIMGTSHIKFFYNNLKVIINNNLTTEEAYHDFLSMKIGA